MEKLYTKIKVIYTVPEITYEEKEGTTSKTFEKVINTSSEECRKVEIRDIESDFAQKLKLNKVDGFIKFEEDAAEMDLQKWLEPFDEFKLNVNIIDFVIKFYSQNTVLFENGEFDIAKITSNFDSQGYSFLKTSISFL